MTALPNVYATTHPLAPAGISSEGVFKLRGARRDVTLCPDCQDVSANPRQNQGGTARVERGSPAAGAGYV